MSEIEFCNLTLTGLTKELLNEKLLDTSSFTMVVTVNAEFIVEAQKNHHFKQIINNSVSTLDGQVPFFFAKFQNKDVEIEKISGSDYVYEIIRKSSENNLKIFVLGGKEESNHQCVQNIKDMYGVNVDGFSPPFEKYPFSDKNSKLIKQQIEAFTPDIILVCFGAIKQEYWINDNAEWLHEVGCNFAIGCGGTVDFVAGNIKRAPVFIQKFGLEGIYRLMTEPKLFRLKRIFKSFAFFKYLW